MSAAVTTLTENEIDPYSANEEKPYRNNLLKNPELSMPIFDIKNLIIFILVNNIIINDDRN